MGQTKFQKPPAYLAGYSPAQLRIILEEQSCKQVIAAAGSGKTRTVIGFVEHLLREQPGTGGRILLLSFSRKAVAELRERLPVELAGAPEISTFHSFCYRQLGRTHPRFQGKSPVILSDEEKRDFYHDRLRREGEAIGGLPFDLLLANPAFFRRNFPEISMRVRRAFFTFKRESGKLEYEDLIALLVNDLERGAPYLEELRRYYDTIIVDEFQDTDPRQLRFLKQMSCRRLLVVGDDKQAIYSFRGATVRPFLDFSRIFRGVKRYQLAENYRSLEPIVRSGNRVIRASRRQLPQRVRAVRGRGPELPVCALPLRSGTEDSLVEILSRRQGYRMVTRSNFRRRIWLQAGIHQESVLTIHRAKGLEFPVVFLDLIGGWKGREEIDSTGSSRDRFDEEIRIAYVGLTRAMNMLVVLHRPEYREGEAEGKIFNCFGRQLRTIDLRRLVVYLDRERDFRREERWWEGGRLVAKTSTEQPVSDRS